jgi:hypothetical protein
MKPQSGQIVIVHGDLPDTLIGMSVMGPANIYPNPYKGTVKYYVNWWEPNARKAYLRCHMAVNLPTSGRPRARSARLSVAFSASTESPWLLQIPTPKNAFDVDNVRFRMHHFEEKLFKEMTGQEQEQTRGSAATAAARIHEGVSASTSPKTPA